MSEREKRVNGNEIILPTDRFLEDYRILVASPAILLNGKGAYTYKSDPKVVDTRVDNYRRFMCEGGFGWGTTISAEAWTYILAHLAYPALLDRPDRTIGLRLTPTALDATHDYARDSRVAPPQHQKGADLFFYEYTSLGCVPLLFIDVTLGDQYTIDAKNARLLIQAETETPVIVVGLSHLQMLRKIRHESRNFVAFLEHTSQLIATGDEIRQKMRKILHRGWEYPFRRTIKKAIDVTADRLAQDREYPFPEKIKVARQKLAYAKGILTV